MVVGAAGTVAFNPIAPRSNIRFLCLEQFCTSTVRYCVESSNFKVPSRGPEIEEDNCHPYYYYFYQECV